jgi:hypothetical protein
MAGVLSLSLAFSLIGAGRCGGSSPIDLQRLTASSTGICRGRRLPSSNSQAIPSTVGSPVRFGPAKTAALTSVSVRRTASLYVASHVEELPGRNKVEESVTGKRDFVRQAIDVLVAEDFLAEEPGPRNARLLRLMKPYREGGDDAI